MIDACSMLMEPQGHGGAADATAGHGGAADATAGTWGRVLLMRLQGHGDCC